MIDLMNIQRIAKMIYGNYDKCFTSVIFDGVDLTDVSLLGMEMELTNIEIMDTLNNDEP